MRCPLFTCDAWQEVPDAQGGAGRGDGIPDGNLRHASVLISALPWNAPTSSMWESGVSRDLGCVSSPAE